MSSLSLTDVVGLMGATLIVVTYFLLQAGKLDARTLPFSTSNALGAAAIMFSLLYEFNLSAFLIEAFWFLISLYGVYRAFRRRGELGYGLAESKD